MLLEGDPLAQVARYVQEEHGECTDISAEAMARALKRYRSHIPNTAFVQRAPHVVQEAVAELRDGLDEVQELEDLYRIQMERLQIDLKNEKNIGKLLPSMTREVKQAREILISLAQLKIDLGLAKPNVAPEETTLTLVEKATEDYDSPAVRRVLGNAESRRKLMSLADRFMSYAAEQTAQVVDVTPVESESDTA